MHRRNVLTAAVAAFGGLFAASRARAEVKSDKPKVVYHLSDADKVDFVLGNIRNHYAGMGGPDNVTIALVVHGPALKAFQAATTTSEIAEKVSVFAGDGLALNACENTLKGQRLTVEDLLPGFVAAKRGGVIRIAELQAAGYVYLRP